jgi:ABC transport system ATP-binding/permease protein
MSTGILKALMQLFAIITREGNEESSQSAREIVAILLQQQLNKELVSVYLGLYDEFYQKHHAKKRDGVSKNKKRTSLNSVKVLRICTQINEELEQKEKYAVLVRLIEFISSFAQIDEQDWEFVETVAETFNIEKEIYTQIKSLSQTFKEEYVEDNQFLYLKSEFEHQPEIARHIQWTGLDGTLVFYRLENESLFFVHYFGDEEVTLNGQSLGSKRSHVFNQGASIRGARFNPIYYSDVIHRFLDNLQSSKIEFRAENVQYYFNRNDQQALYQLSIAEKSGSLIGIMGASGSGKSTLLNVLNGNYTPTYGAVTINGIDIHRQADEIEGVIGYVAQDDLLIDELTVFQNLYYNSKLCFADKDDEALEEVVTTTLQQLGLLEAKDLKVGSPLEKTISGGQRKRLNIALELIREPSVLFIDEPTSGLSSRDSENIMDLLKELTLRGKLIFVVIHQPSSDIFKMFDKLFILDQGGYPIYYGNPVESIIYFKRLVNHANITESECPRCGNVNPEQIFNIIESKVVDEYGNLTEHRKITPPEWSNFYNVMIGNHIASEENIGDPPQSSFMIPGKVKQFVVFFQRDVLSKLANTQYILINALEAPVLAFVLSYFVKYYQVGNSMEVGYIFRESENIPQFLFISVIVALFLGLTVSAEEIIRDQMILQREKFLNLSKGSYLISKIGIMFIISAIQALLFVLIGNAILEIKGMWFPFWIILFSTSCFANLLGLNISATFNSAKVIYILIPILIIPQLLFSGVIVKFDKLTPIFSSQSGVPLIGNVMASRWAFEALAVYQYKNNEYERNFFEHEKDMRYFNWKKDFWVNEVKNKVTTIKKDLNNGDQPDRLASNLALVQKELNKEQETARDFVFDGIDNLTPEKVNYELLGNVIDAVDMLLQYYKAKYRFASTANADRIDEMSSTTEDRDGLRRLKDDYFNERLEEFVINKDAIHKIVEYNGELFQKSNPVYLTPVHKPFFGAHFYAPTKRFFGNQITTFSANLMVIWGMTLLLTAILFVDGMRKVIEGISALFARLSSKVKKRG